MRPAGKPSRTFGRGRRLEAFVLEPDLDERIMLLELANDLRQWDVRNEAFRQALERTASDLIHLAAGPALRSAAERDRPRSVACTAR